MDLERLSLIHLPLLSFNQTTRIIKVTLCSPSRRIVTKHARIVRSIINCVSYGES